MPQCCFLWGRARSYLMVCRRSVKPNRQRGAEIRPPPEESWRGPPRCGPYDWTRVPRERAGAASGGGELDSMAPIQPKCGRKLNGPQMRSSVPDHPALFETTWILSG